MSTETTLINIGNKKALKIKYDLKGDLFSDPILMDQITAGGSYAEDWFMDPDLRFLIVQRGGETLGAIYFYYVLGASVVNIHIAVKREFQLRYSRDVAKMASRWFAHHPTITLLEIIIPNKSKQAIRFAKLNGFVCQHDDVPGPGDGSSGTVSHWYRAAKIT